MNMGRVPDIFGMAAATITPFGPGGGEIDYSFVEKHLELLGREGAQGVVPVGTNGEFPSLTLEEKKKVIEVTAAVRRAGEGDLKKAAKKVADLRRILTDFPWVAATQTALSLRGLPETFVRPPLVDLKVEQKRELKARPSALGLV